MATINIPGGTLTLVANYNKSYYGLAMPKGAVYGSDAKGLFVCYDYRVKKWVTWHTPERGDFDMPVLKVWRNKHGAWYSKTEVSTTTGAIIEWFENGKGYPTISWGDDKFQISTKGVRLKTVKAPNFAYYEFRLPVGAIYGSDEKGVFICKNITPRGFYNGLPRIEIFRPVVGGIERRNTTKWQKSIERGKTAYAIWDKVKRENIELDYSNDAEEVARRQDVRVPRDTVPYTGLGFAYRKGASGASFVAYETARTLDEVAENQKGHAVFTGTYK